MQSTSKTSLLATTRRAANRSHDAVAFDDAELASIEIDSIYGHLLGLRDRQRVSPLMAICGER